MNGRLNFRKRVQYKSPHAISCGRSLLTAYETPPVHFICHTHNERGLIILFLRRRHSHPSGSFLHEEVIKFVKAAYWVTLMSLQVRQPYIQPRDPGS